MHLTGAERGDIKIPRQAVAAEQMCSGIKGFDMTREVRFSSYATPTVLGEIKRHFRDKTWAMRLPRGMQAPQT